MPRVSDVGRLAATNPVAAIQLILTTLEQTGGNLSLAAERLGVVPMTVQRLLDKLEIRGEVGRRWPRRDRPT